VHADINSNVANTSLIAQHLNGLDQKGQGRTSLIVILSIMSQRLSRNRSCSNKRAGLGNRRPTHCRHTFQSKLNKHGHTALYSNIGGKLWSIS